MITDDNWIEFIQSFFGIKAPQEWIRHVASNWNPLKNEPGCDCYFEWWHDEPKICDGYKELLKAKLEEKEDSVIQVSFVDVEDEQEES